MLHGLDLLFLLGRPPRGGRGLKYDAGTDIVHGYAVALLAEGVD